MNDKPKPDLPPLTEALENLFIIYGVPNRQHTLDYLLVKYLKRCLNDFTNS